MLTRHAGPIPTQFSSWRRTSPALQKLAAVRTRKTARHHTAAMRPKGVAQLLCCASAVRGRRLLPHCQGDSRATALSHRRAQGRIR
jgi:hypothetical protein